jgi:alanine racemase
MVEGRLRPVWAEVDLDALAWNVAAIRRTVAPAQLCAVVKADAYGHGAVAVAKAARAAGATWLAVALPDEGIELREAGVDGPILVLSEPDPAAVPETLAAALTPTVYRPEGLAAVAAAAEDLGSGSVACTGWGPTPTGPSTWRWP